MAKRFIDSRMWTDKWFRNLKPSTKLFWIYLFNNCDNAGVWEVDFELSSLLLGIEISADIHKEINNGKDRIRPIHDGRYWFITEFVEFQYGELSDSCYPHRKVKELLKEHGLPLTNSLASRVVSTLEDIDKDKDKEEDKGGVGGFKKFWDVYPRKKSKGQAEKAWLKIQPDEQLQDRILKAVESAKTSVEWQDAAYIPYPATWLRAKGWEDEVRQLCQKCKGKGKFISKTGYEIICECGK